ncbi:MAG: ABC transporter substrate-binding protein [Deltaproteobacteria bacterium]|nr:MAG: ABC transporter substrate-binding protein [Deltaproteobacteria bacterium]
MLLALPYPTTNFLPFYAAEDLGFSSRAGVDLHCIHVRETKERKVRLCLAGDLDFYTSISTTVEAVLRGWGDVKALCSNQTTLYFCAARQEIAELNDLQGKRVMVGGGASNNQITYLSKKLGWILGSDITIVRGDALDRIRAFEDPAIAAVIAREEYAYWAVKAGWRLIPYPEEYMRWHGGGLCTSARLIHEQPDTVFKAVKAVVLATDYLNHHRQEAIELACKRISHLSREDAEGNYDIHMRNGGYTCAITEEGIRYQSEVLASAKGVSKKVSLREVSDLSFLEKARVECNIDTN